jgi:hypothetical protein
MKKAIAAVAIAGVLILAWQAWAKYEAWHEEAHVAQAKRDVAYQTELARFQGDLPLGMPRSEVDKYLDSRQTSYAKVAQDIDVNVGSDPGDGIVCDRWNVYVELHFSRLKKQTDPSPFDNLDSISIQRRGHCL